MGAAAGVLAEREERERARRLESERRAERAAVVQGIAGLSSALGFRDEYTRAHSEHVARLSVDVGVRLGLGGERLELLRLAALMHDVDVFDILIQPIRKNVAAAALEQTKLRVASEVLSLAAEVKEAFFTLQARQQLVTRLRLVMDVTQTAASFARKQREAGTIDDLALENQLALHRQSKVEVALAEAEVRSDRERLNRLLGLWGADTTWRIASQLPELPQQEIPLKGLESLAVAQRQDLQAARWGVDLVGRALALKRNTRFFPVGINVGINTEKDVVGERVTGPELSLQLPIFDTGAASIARLQSEHRRAQRQLEALAVNARSEVRETRDRMLAARDRATYYGQVLLPQRVRILDLTIRQYNAMFKGAYDLLLAKQAHVEAERAHVEAQRDYWIARARLERALGGALPADGPGGAKGAAGAAPSSSPVAERSGEP